MTWWRPRLDALSGFWMTSRRFARRRCWPQRTRANPGYIVRRSRFELITTHFPATPLPPEEPTAENPPNGAMLDYFLPAAANSVQLEIFDAQQNLVRRFSSEDLASKSGQQSQKGPATWKRPPLPVAERWFPKPEVVATTAGMHRFVWNLTWSSSGGPSADEEAEFRNPSGPKALPGTYEVHLTVDGKTQEQSLRSHDGSALDGDFGGTGAAVADGPADIRRDPRCAAHIGRDCVGSEAA